VPKAVDVPVTPAVSSALPQPVVETSRVEEDKTHSFSDFLYSDERANLDNQYNTRLEEMRKASVSAFAPVNAESTEATSTAKPDTGKGTSVSGQIINTPTPVTRTPTPSTNAPVNRFRLEQDRRKGLQ
jgi:hypothetical protein